MQFAAHPVAKRRINRLVLLAHCALCVPVAARKQLTLELVQLIIDKDDRGSDAGGSGSGAAGSVRGLNACEHAGMPPLAHLLELALSHMLEAGFDAMEVRRVEWQVSLRGDPLAAVAQLQHCDSRAKSSVNRCLTLLPLPLGLP